jgi:hypothetical protein
MFQVRQHGAQSRAVAPVRPALHRPLVPLPQRESTTAPCKQASIPHKTNDEKEKLKIRKDKK